MATRTDSRFSSPSMRTLDYVAIALVVITGVVHLYEGVEDWGEPIAIWFLLAGVGFFGAIVLFWLGVSRTLLYLGGVVFTGIQVVESAGERGVPAGTPRPRFSAHHRQ